MKRFLICLGWYVLLSIVISSVGGAVAGWMSSGNPSVTGYQAGYNFGQQYAAIIHLGSFAVAVIGTLTGLLPYTKKEE